MGHVIDAIRRLAPQAVSFAMREQADVIVVGAGVIGMMTARLLHLAGLRVSVLERGLAGREASWAGAGILAPLRPWDYPEPVWRLCERSRELYPGLSRELHESTGIDPQWLDCGAVRVAPDDDERARALAWHRRYELPCEVLPGGDLRMSWVGQIRNPRLCKALIADLRRLDVELVEACEVLGLLRDDAGRVIGVDSTQGPFHAPRVVIAAGAWSAGLSPTPVPVEPIRGEMLLLRPGVRLEPHVYLLPRTYVIVRADGLVLTGATQDRVGFDKRITEAAREMLWHEAIRHLPELRDAEVLRQWAGLRPGSPDGVPLIGPDPEVGGLWLNAGHFRNGLAMAPASAERLATELMA